jgi:foldase protein PrsA
MKKAIVVAVASALLVPAFLLAGCGDKTVPAGAIAAIGSGVVTQEQFDQIWAQAKAQYATQQGAPEFPKEGTAQYNQLKASIVNYLVQNEVVAQAAADKGVKVTDKQLQERIKQITQQVGGQKKLDALLKKQGVTMDDLTTQLKASMLLEAMRAKVGAETKITDKQLQAYYNDPQNRHQFQQAEMVDARHILVKTKAEAEKVKALLEADDSDANWKKVAAEYSIDPGTKKVGGALGSFPQGRMAAPFDKAAFKLEPNTISDPVKTKFGWHVIEVTKKTPAATQTFDKVKEQIRSMLLYQQQATAWQKWLDKAMKDAAIVYAVGFDPSSLTASPSPAAPTQPSPSAT